MPWTTANGISVHYQLAGQSGPVVVLLHEMGGTLESWDAVAPGLAEHYRVVRYDQRGAGLTEKVRKQFTNDQAVDDLEAVLRNLDLKPPYRFVCVAAASTQVLRFLERHPDQVASIVLCNPAPGVDPSRAGALNERADLAEREGMAGVMGITLDKSYPPTLGEPAAYEAYRGRYLANDPVGFGLAVGGIADRVRGVILFDALFAEFDKFADWIARHPQAFLFSAYGKAARSEHAELQLLLNERQIKFATTVPTRLASGSVALFSVGDDVKHNDFVTQSWVPDPLKFMLAKVPGFGRSGGTPKR